MSEHFQAICILLLLFFVKGDANFIFLFYLMYCLDYFSFHRLVYLNNMELVSSRLARSFSSCSSQQTPE